MINNLNLCTNKIYENITAFNLSKCNNLEGCPVWYRSKFSLIPTLSIIGNVSKSTGILILNGENDSQTPVQQAFLLQQRLTEVNHPDHTLITYPNLGHVVLSFISMVYWNGPIEQYVLADIYVWLEAHSGFTNHSSAERVCLLLLVFQIITPLLSKITQKILCGYLACQHLTYMWREVRDIKSLPFR